jgi:hypothetical protein
MTAEMTLRIVIAIGLGLVDAAVDIADRILWGE